MRFTFTFETADEPGVQKKIRTTPGDIVKLERQYDVGMGNVMSEGKLAPMMFMLHNAVSREARVHPERWPNGVQPFDQWVEEDLLDFDLTEEDNLPPKSERPQKTASPEA